MTGFRLSGTGSCSGLLLDELVGEGEFFTEFLDGVSYLCDHGLVFDVFGDGFDPLGDLVHLGFFHAAGGDGGGTQAEAAGVEGAGGVAGDAVIVGLDVRPVERLGQGLAGQVFVAQVDEHQVVVGPAGDEVESVAHQLFGQAGGVLYDLFGVRLKVRGQGLGQGDGQPGDRVHVGSALQAGEDGLVDGGFVLGLEEDHAAAGAAKGLVCGCRDDVGVGDRAHVGLAGDQAGDVGHVRDVEGADFFGDVLKRGKVDRPRVGAGA